VRAELRDEEGHRATESYLWMITLSLTGVGRLTGKAERSRRNAPGREGGETPGDQESDWLQVETPVVSGY